MDMFTMFLFVMLLEISEKCKVLVQRTMILNYLFSRFFVFKKIVLFDIYYKRVNKYIFNNNRKKLKLTRFAIIL